MIGVMLGEALYGKDPHYIFMDEIAQCLGILQSTEEEEPVGGQNLPGR